MSTAWLTTIWLKAACGIEMENTLQDVQECQSTVSSCKDVQTQTRQKCTSTVKMSLYTGFAVSLVERRNKLAMKLRETNRAHNGFGKRLG